LIQPLSFRQVIGVVFAKRAARVGLQRRGLTGLQIGGANLQRGALIGGRGLELALLALTARERQ